jgi:seryl-tRNA synthetase
MLDPHWVREHVADVEAALARRGAAGSLDGFRELDRQRRDLLVRIESRKKHRNESSRKIGELVKSGRDAEQLKAEMRQVGDEIVALESDLQGIEARLGEILDAVPNVPHDSVPDGAGEQDNRVERTWGEPRSFGFEPRAHWDLGAALGILDFDRAARIAGARFALYLREGARLERALIAFMLDLHTREHGYVEVLPPFLVNARAMYGTGQLPKFESDLFRTSPGDLYLVPTAEVPVTNIHADEILDAADLPIAYCAYTPCFRSEAGSYGKDVRGLIRQHQFNKVELVRFATPASAGDELELLTGHAEEVLRRLALPYRVVSLCAGDLGFSATKTYDLEVWLAGQGTYREISSCSSFSDFQARRAKIRYRPEPGGKAAFLHTLNGSGLAVGRTLVALLEHYQEEDGSVTIPDALRPYMDGRSRIGPPGA